MNVTCLIHSLNGGGAERVMAGLTSRLARRSHGVTLLTLDDGKQDRYNVDPAVERVCLDVMSPEESLGFWPFGKLRRIFDLRQRVRKIQHTLKQIDPDVVLSFCDRTNVLAGLAVKKNQSSKSSKPLPLIVCERSDPVMQTLPLDWRLLRKWSYPNARLIATQTRAAARYFSAGGPCDLGVPTAIVGSAVDEPPFKRDAKVAAEQKIILGIGRLSPEKGFDRLIHAFAALPKQHSQWRLRILGDGPQRAVLQRLVESLGLSSRVEMPGWIRPAWNELAQAAIFVLPSRYEGFPSVLLEAMAVGVPSISLNSQIGSCEIVEHNLNGLIVDDAVEQITQAIVGLTEDTKKRERIGAAGIAVRDHYSWETMTDKFEVLLRRVTHGETTS